MKVVPWLITLFLLLFGIPFSIFVLVPFPQHLAEIPPAPKVSPFLPYSPNGISFFPSLIPQHILHTSLLVLSTVLLIAYLLMFVFYFNL